MSELSWLAMSLLTAVPGMAAGTTTGTEAPVAPPTGLSKSLCVLCLDDFENEQQAIQQDTIQEGMKAIAASISPQAPQFSTRLASTNSTSTKSTKPAPAPELAYLPRPTLSDLPRPSSGSQQYQQRLAALRAGMTYTRLPATSFWERWSNAAIQPTYEQWVSLLRAEAQSMARGQGSNRLSVLLGDSISQWFPTEDLSSNGFWLNQGISGDTTSGVLRRLGAIANTRPDTIHLMIGINDLRRGASDTEVLNNIYAIVRQLKQQHPQAEIVLYSILPTRLPALSTERIQGINRVVEAIAQHTQSRYIDLHPNFIDETGILRRELTTDGLHLSRQGYALWSWALGGVG